jgi:hypothetical protein
VHLAWTGPLASLSLTVLLDPKVVYQSMLTSIHWHFGQKVSAKLCMPLAVLIRRFGQAGFSLLGSSNYISYFSIIFRRPISVRECCSYLRFRNDINP